MKTQNVHFVCSFDDFTNFAEEVSFYLLALHSGKDIFINLIFKEHFECVCALQVLNSILIMYFSVLCTLQQSENKQAVRCQHHHCQHSLVSCQCHS